MDKNQTKEWKSNFIKLDYHSNRTYRVTLEVILTYNKNDFSFVIVSPYKIINIPIQDIKNFNFETMDNGYPLIKHLKDERYGIEFIMIVLMVITIKIIQEPPPVQINKNICVDTAKSSDEILKKLHFILL